MSDRQLGGAGGSPLSYVGLRVGGTKPRTVWIWMGTHLATHDSWLTMATVTKGCSHMMSHFMTLLSNRKSSPIYGRKSRTTSIGKSN